MTPRHRRRPWTTAASGLAVALLLAQADEASSQTSALTAATPPSVQHLIERLGPGPTRGIRIPANPGAAGTAAAGGANEPPLRAGGGGIAPHRSAAASAPGTTAPPGTPATSLSVLFATGSDRLTPQAERLLDVLGQALASSTLAPYRFRIEGHTDTVGTPEFNHELSERRAIAVRDHLTRRFGVDPARLEAVGLGESQLLVRTPDQTPEARNRRVQVVNLGV
jgi:OmpA-OmpF porin, OOP family